MIKLTCLRAGYVPPQPKKARVKFENPLRAHMKEDSAEFFVKLTMKDVVLNYCKHRGISNPDAWNWLYLDKASTKQKLDPAMTLAQFGDASKDLTVRMTIHLSDEMSNFLTHIYKENGLETFHNLVNFVGACHPDWEFERIRSCTARMIPSGRRNIRRAGMIRNPAGWGFAQIPEANPLDGGLTMNEFLAIYADSFASCQEEGQNATNELVQVGYPGNRYKWTQVPDSVGLKDNGCQLFQFLTTDRPSSEGVIFGGGGGLFGRGNEGGAERFETYPSSIQLRLNSYLSHFDWWEDSEHKKPRTDFGVTFVGGNGQDYSMWFRETKRDSSRIYFEQQSHKYNTIRKVRAEITDDKLLPEKPKLFAYPEKEIQQPGYWGQNVPAVGAARIPMTGQLQTPNDLVAIGNGNQAHKKPILQFVSNMFNASAGQYTIVSIEAIVNRSLFRKYASNYSESSVLLGPQLNERLVWHGTNGDAIDKIMTTGFDRNYGDKEAYGHGVYFARDASYSTSHHYAKRDSNGHGHVLLCRLIVGECTLGNARLRLPVPKPAPKQNFTYETYVNRMEDPSVFVSTRDFMAYPAFLVTFKD